ncbi:transcriptional activator protein acu-15 [Achaetomium macrosporum]|uniref:Transcriptional activator protein acu-15 n=1 Tax=Achaetomium macrosporum TaxID=79813 RepID=A0AAN7CB85_9PEZI|nr:transcriptional activator protein acu-15 [Achaetomium macrosporum]
MSASSPEDVTSEASGSAATAPAHEPLACVSCRARKLKCDRQKPVCSRCAKAGGECVYPESRRKPAFKRRNVRELEERLAQVEGLLRSVGKHRASQSSRSDGARTERLSPGALGRDDFRPDRLQGSPGEGEMPWFPLSPDGSPQSRHRAYPGELLGLGQFESLPPFEMIEDLHAKFFATQEHFLPIIHPGNYLRAFHSPPHMRPPMSLQYAIWTVAANGDPKYGCYHDALYRRARQYLEADELKGYGEHFITIGHAQAWALVAIDEARCLMFTRASMSSARSIRLAGMMGLHRLDSTVNEEEAPMAPMITPPRSWAELEERRRLFWAGYCVDTYASISAGWPTLIDLDLVTTHLPASEDAFTRGVEEKSSTLQDAFRGFNYSKFAGNIVICHIFTRLMKHAHRPMPDDNPEDPEFGAFWKRHRELDNMLSSAFMFLPERFRLPRNMRNPVALQTNLSLHAAVICLHLAACEKADKYKLAGIRQASWTRALTATQEIVDIIKTSSHVKTAYQGPLTALSLYLAASVYISQAKDSPEEFDKASFELLVECMKAIGHKHVITHAYLNQLKLDIERNGVPVSVDNLTPSVEYPNKHRHVGHHGIPLVARGSTSRHTRVQPPLPGRLPLGAPQGNLSYPGSLPSVPCYTFVGPYPTSHETDESDGPASKRIRTSARPSSGVLTAAEGQTSTPGPSMSLGGRRGQTSVASCPPALDLFDFSSSSSWSYTTKHHITATLPHRTGSPAMNSRAVPTATSNLVPDFAAFSVPSSSAEVGPSTTTAGPGPTAGFGMNPTAGNTGTNTSTNPESTSLNPEGELGNLDIFGNLGDWDLTDPQSIFGMLLDMSSDDFGVTSQDSSMDPWAALNNAAGGSSSAGGSGGTWDSGGAGGSGSA